ncbi:MAG: ATP/GTP-binding protein [Pauljensenia sp.]
MHLLRFTFENHRSFRDKATLDLTRSTLKTLRRPEGTSWAEHIHHVDGIYGANASGKTNVLDALHYTLSTIGYSATSWLDRPRFTRVPFSLTQQATTAPASFELEFIHNGQRYEHRFVTNTDGIVEESLRVVNTRWKTIYTRSEDGRVKDLSGVSKVSPRELVLSRAAQLRNTTVTPVWEALVRGFDLYHVGDREVRARLDRIARQLQDRTLSLDALVTLAHIADTGITDIEVEERAIPPQFAQLLAQMVSPSNDADQEDTPENSSDDAEELSKFIARNLLFRHGTESGRLRNSDESTGTMAWLALGTAVVSALRQGKVLVVDELGASLHPQLSRLIIDWFEDPSVNKTGAQLIFTSHDMTLLDTGRGDRAKREEVWFVEKGADGASELFNLADFPLQKGSNIVKQYLEGRFGGVPYTAPSLIHNLLGTRPEEEE